MNEEVIKIISEVVEIPVKKIKLESDLINDLELESLDLVNLISEFENRYNITVDDKDIKNLHTVSDIIDYINSHV